MLVSVLAGLFCGETGCRVERSLKLQRIERNSVHAYTLTEAQSLCEQVGLHVVCGKVFSVDWLWHGWVLRAYRTASEAEPAHLTLC